MNQFNRYFKIFGLKINSINYQDLIQLVEKSIFTKKQICITGVNVHTLNLVYCSDSELAIFSSFDILHPDGIGIYLASKIISNSYQNRRMTG